MCSRRTTLGAGDRMSGTGGWLGGGGAAPAWPTQREASRSLCGTEGRPSLSLSLYFSTCKMRRRKKVQRRGWWWAQSRRPGHVLILEVVTLLLLMK